MTENLDKSAAATARETDGMTGPTTIGSLVTIRAALEGAPVDPSQFQLALSLLALQEPTDVMAEAKRHAEILALDD